MDRFDAVVIGGGPAGAAAAGLLARGGWSVGVLESATFPRRKVCGEYLSGTSLPLLDLLGAGEAFRDLAGPPVTRVGLFAGRAWLEAPLPQAGGAWGRALGRESLDTLLLDRAARAGAEVRDGCTVTTLARDGSDWRCLARSVAGDLYWRAKVVIAAHGSWRPGALPTQPRRRPPRPSDLFGFKAHFTDSGLPEGLMPLLCFPGGYGGMVHADGGRVSLSCCVRRDQLAALRRRDPGEAGEAVLHHILDSCPAARRVLGPARREGGWLSAGPIRPGIRGGGSAGAFLVGNAAGEAHPVVAEGISMALQGAWLLARRLLSSRGREADAVAAGYAADWRRAFAPRLYAAAAVAHWAMRPAAVAAALPLLSRLPALLSWGARASGKAAAVVPRRERKGAVLP